MSLVDRQALIDSPNVIFESDQQRSDILAENKVNTWVIQLLKDLCITKNWIFQITAVNSDHDDDSYLTPGPLHIGTHRGGTEGGYAVDGWVLKSHTYADWMSQDDPKFQEFCHDAGLDPADLQVGLGGAAMTHANAVAIGIHFFQDNGADHIHLGAHG